MGNPNKKSNLRKINVDGFEYFWNIRGLNEDNNDKILVIMKDKKTLIRRELNNEEITPSNVEGIIRAFNKKS